MIPRIPRTPVTPERYKVVVYEEGKKVYKEKGCKKDVLQSLRGFFKYK